MSWSWPSCWNESWICRKRNCGCLGGTSNWTVIGSFFASIFGHFLSIYFNLFPPNLQLSLRLFTPNLLWFFLHRNLRTIYGNFGMKSAAEWIHQKFWMFFFVSFLLNYSRNWRMCRTPKSSNKQNVPFSLSHLFWHIFPEHCHFRKAPFPTNCFVLANSNLFLVLFFVIPTSPWEYFLIKSNFLPP